MKSYFCCKNRRPTASFGLSYVHGGSNCLTSNFEGTSNIQNNFFSHNIFLPFHQQVWTILRYRRSKTSCTKNCTCVHGYNFTFNFLWSANFGVQNCFERYNLQISKRRKNNNIHRICWILLILVVKKMNEGVVIRIPIWYKQEVWTSIDRSSTLERFHKRLTAFFWPLEKPYVKRTWHVFVDRKSSSTYFRSKGLVLPTFNQKG